MVYKYGLDCKWNVNGVKGSGFRVQGCGGGFAANIYGAMPEGLRVAGFPRIASLPRVGKVASVASRIGF